jgi:hypothetical protein
VYVNGYDFSGYSHEVGPLTTEFDVDPAAAFTEIVKGGLPGMANINIGTLNGFLDNTATSGLHVLANTGTGTKNVMIPIGIRAAPANGDPCFCAQVEQKNYIAPISGSGLVNITAEFAGSSAAPTTRAYQKGWGTLLHASGAETGANTGTGFNDPVAAQTTAGGYLMYQVFAANGTGTISIDDSANNVDFLALSGATTGSLTFAAGSSGIVALGTTATVRQYLRWQMTKGSLTSITFALAFIRG